MNAEEARQAGSIDSAVDLAMRQIDVAIDVAAVGKLRQCDIGGMLPKNTSVRGEVIAKLMAAGFIVKRVGRGSYLVKW